MREGSVSLGLTTLLAVIITVQGCTRWGEVQYQMSNDRFFVHFGCNEETEIPVTNIKRKPLNSIVVQGAPEPDSLHIGDLFWMEGDKPVYITGASPNTVLVEDIKKILTRNSFTVSQDTVGSEVILVADITALGAASGVWKGNPFDPGSTIGQIDYTVTLRHGETTLWSEDFSEKVVIKAAYAYVKDMETVMNRAYCNTLKPLEAALTSEEFHQALVRSEQSM